MPGHPHEEEDGNEDESGGQQGGEGAVNYRKVDGKEEELHI